MVYGQSQQRPAPKSDINTKYNNVNILTKKEHLA
jgi:hypothetical protein